MSRSPSLGACNFPIFLSRRFRRSIFSLNSTRIPIPSGTSVTNCNHKHGLMLTSCQHVHVITHCFIPTEACSCRLELAYFAGKISKNRLVCKNAIAFAYSGLLVRAVCFGEGVVDLATEDAYRLVSRGLVLPKAFNLLEAPPVNPITRAARETDPASWANYRDTTFCRF